MTQQYQHILVPVDGSKEAELAFKKAVAVAKRNGADTELRLLHVVDTRAFQNISSFDSSMVEQVTTTAKKTLDQYVDYAKNKALPMSATRLNTARLRRSLPAKCQRKCTLT